MEALRRFMAIVVADLRERSRTPRFWIVLGLVAWATWGCFPSLQSGMVSVSFGDNARGAYSSAWIGMTVGLIQATLLSLVGFYLVRGTLVRDFDTRVWQLLVATPMTRSAYLLAKWASHMAVFSLLLFASVAVSLVAQWVRAEDRAIDLVELCKPAVLLALPSLAFTAFLAVLFDLIPWTRRTLGNVLYFFVWTAVLAVSANLLEKNGVPNASPWLSDPGGMIMAGRDLIHGLASTAPWVDTHSLSVTIPMGDPVKVRLFAWTHWTPNAEAALGRVLWVVLPMLGVAALAPLLDRAAARTQAAKARANSGRRLRWLDRVLGFLDYSATGRLVSAELKGVLRARVGWWWLALVISWGVQAAGSKDAMTIAVIVAWLASTDVFSRAILRERSAGTGALVFTAVGAAKRLLVARVSVSLVLALFAALPALVRLGVGHDAAAVVLLLVAVQVALFGLAFGVVFRSPRPFELGLVVVGYMGVQGQGPLAFAAASSGPAPYLVMIAASMGALVVGWRLMTSNAVIAQRLPKFSGLFRKFAYRG